MSARYLTTTLPYVNADPHIGFALELVQADVRARVWRSNGDDVFFNTGTDEHGQKIFEAAQKAGQDIRAYVDHYAGEVRKLKDALDLTSDAFIRTTDPAHVKAAQEIWRRCEANGDIYLKEYEGLYCVGHEAFITEKDLVGGKCPEHDMKPELLREKNYFFKFKNYEKPLLQYLEKPGVILPEWRRLEAINFVKGGLEDFSISREAKRLSWGIPVPGDDSQVVYVWFDALTNYISTLGWPQDTEGKFKKFWENGETLQIAGKDQVRFQSLMWQAMLLSAGVKNTDTIFYHGFITSGGQKMSKSLGNVISPYELVKRYGTDATRYILLRHISPVEDSDVTRERLDEWYTANLANGLGNLVARVMKLSEEYIESPAHLVDKISYVNAANLHIDEHLEKFEFNRAMDEIWGRIQALDEAINRREPFKLVKKDLEEGKAVILSMAAEVYGIGSILAPFMPKTSEKILTTVRENKKPDNLFPRL